MRGAFDQHAAGEHDAALRSLRAALVRAPDHEPALTLLARILYETGRSAEGVRYFAARPTPAWPEAVRLDVALLLAAAGQRREARRLLDELSGGAHAQAARANLAWLDLLEGRTEAAVTQLEELARRDESPQVLHNLALARLHAGDVAGSARLLERLVERDFAPARHSLALLLRHYRFDDEAAAQVEQAAAPQAHLSDAAVEELLQGAEDATPPSGAAGEGGTASGRSEHGTR